MRQRAGVAVVGTSVHTGSPVMLSRSITGIVS